MNIIVVMAASKQPAMLKVDKVVQVSQGWLFAGGARLWLS
jgi:hypothetical protein